MLTSIFKAWKNNHGIQLFFIGIVVGLLMCLLWWKQWLPEIRFNDMTTSNGIQIAANGVDGIFVARIEGSIAQKSAIGGLLIFNPFAENPADIPNEVTPFQLDLDGNATVVLELQPGKYAAVAYLDENRNGRLDIDEKGQAVERFCTSSTTHPWHDWRELEDAAFTVSTAEPAFRLMKFNK